VTEVTDRPADAGAGDDSAAERDRRIEGLRGKYRSLQEIDERQRSIVAELAAIDAIDDPDGGDFIWQGQPHPGARRPGEDGGEAPEAREGPGTCPRRPRGPGEP